MIGGELYFPDAPSPSGMISGESMVQMAGCPLRCAASQFSAGKWGQENGVRV